MLNENIVQVKVQILEKKISIGLQSSQQQANLEDKETETVEIGRFPMAVSRLSSNLSNITVQYIEGATKAQQSLQDYYTSHLQVQLNLLENISSMGFTKRKELKLLKQIIIYVAQFWTNLYTLPWKLALGNALCIK
jgi:ABC-type enterochelin transport system ATPase subunit